MGFKIKSVFARSVFARTAQGVETTVVTDDGALGVAVAVAGVSVGKHEVQFTYDGGERWGGKGMLKAIGNIENVIGPAIKGMDVTKQRAVDEVILKLDGTPNKARLGGNAMASVSAAVLKAAAANLGIPLYQHIGGVNACILPVPGSGAFGGSNRYGGGKRSGGKPSVTFYCYGFNSFSEASYAAWEVSREFQKILSNKFQISGRGGMPGRIPVGIVEHDRELFALMTDAIDNCGYKNKIGIQMDVAAGTYYNTTKGVFEGLFSKEDKSKEDLIELYKNLVADYPFVILEDPLDEDDFDGHAIVTKELGIEVVGDDLFTTNIERLKQGIEVGAANAVLLKVNQIGTISEALDTVQLAYRHGYGVMPCSSRGEGPDIADYTVGLSTGHLREGGTGPTANRLLKIESELGNNAKFLGRQGFKP
jgi:enolase